MENKGISKAFIEESLEYLRSDEARESYKNNMLNQIAMFLSHKYNCNITVEGSVISAEGLKEEDKEGFLNDLKDIGML